MKSFVIPLYFNIHKYIVVYEVISLPIKNLRCVAANFFIFEKYRKSGHETKRLTLCLE